jgi:hypothetical protein
MSRHGVPGSTINAVFVVVDVLHGFIFTTITVPCLSRGASSETIPPSLMTLVWRICLGRSRKVGRCRTWLMLKRCGMGIYGLHTLGGHTGEFEAEK